MSIRDLLQTQTASIHAFMLILVGILCFSIATPARGFMAIQQETGGVRPNTMIDKVHKQHWNISYGYGGGCEPDEKNNDAALTEAITEVLQMWLEPLREYTKKPIVNDFRYLLDADRDASDLTVIFHCDERRVSTADVSRVRPLQVDLRKGTKVTRNFMATFLHEIGHVFGLADTYIPGDKWGDPELDKGGLDGTKGTQPGAIMAGLSRHKEEGMLGTDDKNGVVWLYKVIYEGLSIVDCFFTDYELENPPLGCVPKHPLIFSIKHIGETNARLVVEQDETLDLNARDADGLTALHHAFINEYMQVVEALLSFEDIDVNVRDTKGFTALHHTVLLKDINTATDIVERLLANAKIKVNIRSNDGRVPAQLARDIGRFQITKLIWEHPTAQLPPWSVTSKGKLTTTWGHL